MGFAAFLLVRNAVLPGYRLAAIHAVAVLAAGLAGANLPAGHRNRRNSAQFHGLFPAFLVPVGQHARAIATAFALAPACPRTVGCAPARRGRCPAPRCYGYPRAIPVKSVISRSRRSEERSGGKEYGSTCRSRWSQ